MSHSALYPSRILEQAKLAQGVVVVLADCGVWPSGQVWNVNIHSTVESNLRSRGKVIPKMNTMTPPHRDSTK